MSIDRLQGVKVTCDTCMDTYDWTEWVSIADAKSDLQSEDWQFRKPNLAYCPACSEFHNRHGWPE